MKGCDLSVISFSRDFRDSIERNRLASADNVNVYSTKVFTGIMDVSLSCSESRTFIAALEDFIRSSSLTKNVSILQKVLHLSKKATFIIYDREHQLESSASS